MPANLAPQPCAAPHRKAVGQSRDGFTDVDSSPTKSLILRQHDEGEERYFRLTFAKRPAEELYDIRTDPDCMNNLAGQADYQEIREQLRNELWEMLRRTKDPHIVENGDSFERYEYVGADEHSWKAYTEGRFKKQCY